jgi:ParB family chromosome partitioning protein
MDDESVASLAASIERRGLLQPVIVRSVAGRYQIIAGERRWRAAQSLGMTRVPVVVREAGDDEMLELALIENIHREDLNAIDRARAYREFCTRLSVTPEEVAKRLGEDRTTVVNYLRLLDLPESIQAFVAEGRLSMGHARCLLGVADAAHRVRLAESAIENELSVRALEEIVRRERTRRESETTGAATKEQARLAHMMDLQRRFEEALKTKVTIHEGRRKGAGRIVIEYFSLDDFERIAAMLGVRLE